jgi:site-specific recombinase XerD
MPDITFIQWLKNNNLSYRTIKEYERYYSLFSNQLINQHLVNKFLETNNNIVSRAFLRNLKEYAIQSYSDELTPDELTKIYRINLGKSNIKDKPKVERTIISRDDITKIEECFTKEVTKIMFNLQYYCALRTSELFFIKMNDFNWEEWENKPTDYGYVSIHGKGGTLENVSVPSFIMERLRFYIKNTLEKDNASNIKTCYLFNLLTFELPKEPKVKNELDEWNNNRLKYIKMNYDIWNTTLKFACSKALNINKPISTHVLRRSFATYLINNGLNLAEVKEHLRHKDISTTQIYTQISKEQIAKRLKEVLSN